MRRYQMKTVKKIYAGPLRVVRGLKDQAGSIDELVDTAWVFAHTALWNTSIFSNREIEEAKSQIHEQIVHSKNPEKAYSNFCQRVLLARLRLSNNLEKQVALPSIWLENDNPIGFSATKDWYDTIRAIRLSLPAYKAELKAFAEAILEMKQDASRRNFEYWKNYFIEKKAPGLWSLFLQTIARQQFGS